MKGPRVADRPEARRVEILTAAARLISARGYHGMSMRELSSATGMSLANLYHYFAAKDDVLFALQSRAFETLMAAAETAVAPLTDPAARLHAFILSHVRYVATHRDVLHVLIEEAGELSPARRREVRRLKERYFGLGYDLVRALAAASRRRHPIDAAELERATYVVFGMLNWVYAWYRPERHGSPQTVARTIHAIALSGLIARSPTRAAQSATERRMKRVAVVSPIQRRRAGAS